MKEFTKNNIEKKYLENIFNTLSKKEKIDNQKDNSKPVDEATRKWNMNNTIVQLFEKNIESDNKLKRKYAIILIIILIIQLIALNLWFLLKGRGILIYSDSSFNLFISGGIAEVFLLVRVIVKYLFKDNLSESLNIILERNNINKKYNNKFKTNQKYNNYLEKNIK